MNSLPKDKTSLSPNKENYIINTYISKLNSFKKSCDASKVKLMIACNSKLGRNNNYTNKLNPHNTNVSHSKQQKSNVNNPQPENKKMNKFESEIKKLSLDKILKISESPYVTASIEKNLLKANAVVKLKNTKIDHLSPSPGKTLLETNRAPKEKGLSFSKEEIKTEGLIKYNPEQIKDNMGLTEIMSNLTKNNEKKSRNIQRSHIAITSSNLFSSDKAQSMQNVSYQKTELITSNITKKNITLMKPYINNYLTNQKPKTVAVVNKSFTSNVNLKSSLKPNPNLATNKTANNKVNNITIWSVAENKKLQVKMASTNKGNTGNLEDPNHKISSKCDKKINEVSIGIKNITNRLNLKTSNIKI